MKKRILIVEDELIIRLDLKMMLLDYGYDVIGEAGDGDRAIELTHRLKPDLILMDINMPKLNGLKASQVIGRQLDVPVILITAYSERAFIEKSRLDNVMGYLVKPISEEHLLPAIMIALQQDKKTKELKQSLQMLQEQIDEGKMITQMYKQ
ncbi:response regulator [Lysinibacillus piscis]|uniref:Response regulatory domain-containing protein n=1 Tax=Lysinibacillus piscis TaxID=2518931 RepID=A0ABQ5NFK1_9BACI|nr:response regulator [Lysinibacillus sp. KH24]GLC87162.1 hypothetical protein LYSBPC_02890 [Lysinibacillus sp. KH24]